MASAFVSCYKQSNPWIDLNNFYYYCILLNPFYCSLWSPNYWFLLVLSLLLLLTMLLCFLSFTPPPRTDDWAILPDLDFLYSLIVLLENWKKIKNYRQKQRFHRILLNHNQKHSGAFSFLVIISVVLSNYFYPNEIFFFPCIFF